jgi:tetratricopeptide (TPR) repeat protein
MVADAEQRQDEPKARIFISYSRKDMAFADRLEAALKARGFEPLIDRTEIYAFEDWWKRIQALICQADTVVFVLSPDAVTSAVALKEVAQAAALNKRFAPIVCRRIEDSAIPEALRRLNFIFFDDPNRFEASADRLAEALQTDIGWIRQHTEFGEAARDWSAAGRPKGLLLRSPALEEAERWIASRPRSAPEPTAETQRFVAESRSGANRRRNILTGSLSAGLLVALSLAGLAFMLKWQADRAEEHATRSYGTARSAMGELVTTITGALQETQGIRVESAKQILQIVDGTIKKVQEDSNGDPELDRIRAAMLFQAGKTYQKLRDRPSAVAAASQSLQLRARLTHFDQRTSTPAAFASSPAQWRWELSQSFELLGDLDREGKGYANARAKFDETLSVRVQLVQESPGADDPWTLGLSQIYTRLGDLDNTADPEQGKVAYPGAAEQNYERSFAISSKYFLHELDTNKAVWRRELSWSFNKLADIRVRRGHETLSDSAGSAREFAAALHAFQNSLCLRRGIAHKADNAEYTRDVAFSLERIAEVNADLHNRTDAEAAYMSALAIRRQLVQSKFDDMRYRRDLAAAADHIGDYYTTVDDLELALAFYKFAVNLLHQIKLRLGDDPNDPSAGKVVEKAAKKIETTLLRIGKVEGDISARDWWDARISKVEERFAPQAAALTETASACMKGVMDSVDHIVDRGPTAAVF